MTGTEKWEHSTAVVSKWERHMPWILALLAGVLYVLTLSPTISHTDSGELTAVAYTMGIAHPTGYPLFTLLGWLFSHIPIGTVAFRLNLMCLVFMVGAVFFWANFLREFFIQMRTSVKKGDSSYALRIKVANLTGTIAGTLMLVFGRTWWLQSTSSEVYSLQCLLLAMMLWTLLRAWYAKEGVFRAWGIFVVALALCFTNHLTAIVLLPGVLYLYFARFKFTVQSIKQGLGLAGIGLGVLVVFYGMLMFIAQSQPAYNWGNPEDWPRLWHHMTGRQFSVYMFTGPKPFGKNLLGYLNRLPNEWGWDLIWPKIPIWIGLGGMVFQGMTYALQRRREWAIFFAVGFLSNIFWAANYDIKDPEPYFLFSFMAIAFLGAMLIRWSWIGMKKVAPYLTAAYVLATGFQVFWNFGVVNQRGTWQYEDYARACLADLPPNAVVVSKAWDVFVGPCCYLQGVEGFRKDVAVVDYSLLHDRHWYAEQMRAQTPELARSLGKNLDEWEKAVYEFDVKGKINPAYLTPRFNAVYRGILSQLLTRPVYISPDVMDAMIGGEIERLPQTIVPVPERYMMRLRTVQDAQAYQPLPPAGSPIRFGGNTTEYETRLMNTLLYESRLRRAEYEHAFGHVAEATALRTEAETFTPRLEPKQKDGR
jgi:hypothetical protein